MKQQSSNFLNFMEKEILEKENKRLKTLVMVMFVLNIALTLALSIFYIKGV